MTEFLKWTAIIILSLGAFCIAGFSFGSGKPLKHLMINSAAGFSAVALVCLTSRYTGVHIALNPCTAIGAGVYGIPAVCFFLLLDIIFTVL